MTVLSKKGVRNGRLVTEHVEPERAGGAGRVSGDQPPIKDSRHLQTAFT